MGAPVKSLQITSGDDEITLAQFHGSCVKAKLIVRQLSQIARTLGVLHRYAADC